MLRYILEAQHVSEMMKNQGLLLVLTQCFMILFVLLILGNR